MIAPQPVRIVATAALVLALGFSAAACSGEESGDAAASTTTAPPAESAGPAEALVQQGLAQLEAGDDESAAVTFANALTVDPDNVFALYNLGLIHQDRGQDAKARAFYDRALDRHPAFVQALFNRAILTERTDLMEAVALYERAAKEDPTFAAAHMRLGFALQHLGELDRAEEALAEGIRLDPAMANVPAPSYD